jgi:glycosyltransferase involved in cell wall biosynthesis
MRIIIIDTTLTTPPTGGAQTFLVELGGALVERGWTVSVVTQPGPVEEIVASLRRAGVEVREDIWAASDLPEERAARLAAWAGAQRPDVYVVSISPDAGWLALPLLDAHIATVTIAHNDVSAFYEPLKHYHPFVDCAVGVSEDIHRKIVERCHIPAERARRIAYGVHPVAPDEAEARCADSADGDAPLRVGYVGRLVQSQKRVFDFVPLAEELRRRGVAFELQLIGDGSERAALEEEFKKRGLGGSVRFRGWLSPPEVERRLLELDVFLLLSDYEGLPVALLEAMGHALVPVVTAIESGSAEVVRDGESGFVVQVGDVVGAAERLALLARDRETLRRMKHAAWERSREFSVGAMVENYLDCFKRLTGGGSARAYRKGVPRPYPIMQSCASQYPAWLRKLKARLLVLAKGALSTRPSAQDSN